MEKGIYAECNLKFLIRSFVRPNLKCGLVMVSFDYGIGLGTNRFHWCFRADINVGLFKCTENVASAFSRLKIELLSLIRNNFDTIECPCKTMVQAYFAQLFK